MELNPKEYKRIRAHRQDYTYPTDSHLTSLRVIRPDVNYPNIENNWPGFFE